MRANEHGHNTYEQGVLSFPLVFGFFFSFSFVSSVIVRVFLIPFCLLHPTSSLSMNTCYHYLPLHPVLLYGWEIQGIYSLFPLQAAHSVHHRYHFLPLLSLFFFLLSISSPVRHGIRSLHGASFFFSFCLLSIFRLITDFESSLPLIPPVSFQEEIIWNLLYLFSETCQFVCLFCRAELGWVVNYSFGCVVVCSSYEIPRNMLVFFLFFSFPFLFCFTICLCSLIKEGN